LRGVCHRITIARAAAVSSIVVIWTGTEATRAAAAVSSIVVIWAGTEATRAAAAGSNIVVFGIGTEETRAAAGSSIVVFCTCTEDEADDEDGKKASQEKPSEGDWHQGFGQRS
jgi:hypothetical protein